MNLTKIAYLIFFNFHLFHYFRMHLSKLIYSYII